MNSFKEQTAESKIKKCNQQGNYDALAHINISEVLTYRKIIKRTELKSINHSYLFYTYLFAMLEFEPSFKGRFYRTINDSGCICTSLFSGVALAFSNWYWFGDIKHLLWLFSSLLFFAIAMIFKSPDEMIDNPTINRRLERIRSSNDLDSIYFEQREKISAWRWAILNSDSLGLEEKVQLYLNVQHFNSLKKDYKTAIKMTIRDSNFGFGNLILTVTVFIPIFIGGHYESFLFCLICVPIFILGIIYNKH